MSLLCDIYAEILARNKVSVAFLLLTTNKLNMFAIQGYEIKKPMMQFYLILSLN